LNIDGIEHSESNYGVFISNSRVDREKTQMLSGLAQAMIQNGIGPSAVAEMLDDNHSFVKIKDMLKEAEMADQQFQLQLEQAKQQTAQQQQQIEMLRMQHESRENELDRLNKLQIAQISAKKE